MIEDAAEPPPEVWGGVEASVARIGDRYYDQLRASGHDRRPDDLDRFADLGLRALRYPVLWERAAPDRPEAIDWSWADERLGRLRRLGIRPIVGLVHHGSGPRYTDLLDPAFPTLLARYGAAVAARFPWVTAYTPVNEPLTTARFSALYGHWYPHVRDAGAFARALVVQCRATVLTMHAIRRVVPDARLVQTEDLGKTHSTPRLRYQAEFENQRRWLTYDLLCGRVDDEHPMWRYLRSTGIPAEDLEFFVAHPCPPDIIGVNHYVTSERFLDDRVDRYPAAWHGGNGRDRYVDIEAVRILPEAPEGLLALLREAWQRYGRPLAATEVHLGCTREEQMRWLLEAWRAATALRREGADVRAVTVWGLLGSFDWDSLMTLARGRYEPGAFDARGPQPRPTALAQMTRDLVAGRTPTHPVLDAPGWWRRHERLLFPPADEPLAA